MSAAGLLSSLRDRIPHDRLLTEPGPRRAVRVRRADGVPRAAPRPSCSPRRARRSSRPCGPATASGVPFVARGSGTSLSGGSLPVEGGIVIALNRLNRDPAARPRRARRRGGAGRDQPARVERRRPHGLFYAPDPSSQSICTIGGNIAFNSGGAHCLKHGMTTNHVLGDQGRAARRRGRPTSAPTAPSPSGPDWLGLFVGSEGLFGIALEVTLRLLPLPEATHTVLAAYRRPGGGRRRGRERRRRRAAAGRDGDHGRAGHRGRARRPCSPATPTVPALLIVELDGERELRRRRRRAGSPS